MNRKTVRKKDRRSGAALLTLAMTFCIMMLLEPVWINLTGGSCAGAEDSSFLSTLFEGGSSVSSLPAPAYEITTAYPDASDGFLPVCSGRRTGQRMVAITIDDCNQAHNLQQMVQLISVYGGKGTIFPIGENVSFLAPVLRGAVAKGFEIENHTQSHSGLFAQSDEELAYQIWQQNREVSLALGYDYQMHFLRPKGGDNRYDQRTHAYMRQMGYCGMAYWTQEGSLSTADEIMARLKPGDILLFHTTDYDLQVITELVPLLHAAGYRMVTLNEMFDLPANERSELTQDAAVLPLAEYERFDQDLKRNDYLHDVLLMQQRLTQLGYLNDKCDGCFGANTENAVKHFQQDAGLPVSGICDTATWNALFGE